MCGKFRYPNGANSSSTTLKSGRFDLAPLLFAFVPLADNELKVLQEHLAQGAHRLCVLIHIQRHEQNEFLLDHFVQRKQILIGPGDDTQLIVEKRHALVQQSLNLRNPFPVLKRLV